MLASIVAVPVDVSADWFAGSADLRADWLKLYDENLKGYDECCSYVFLHQRANVDQNKGHSENVTGPK